MSNSVNSTPGNPRIIQINTPGPQGPQGPAGSITTGSLSGDFNALNITASGNISASGYIQSNEYYLEQAKVLFAEDGKVKIGNTQAGTVIEGTSLVLNSDTQIIGSTMTSGVISSSLVSTNYSLIANSASFNYISASTGDFDNNTIRIGGSSWSKSDIDNLKLGRSIATDQDKSMKNSSDSTTYIRNDTSAKMNFYISDSPVIQLGIGSATIGNKTTSVRIGDAGITGGMLVTGSTEISGSCVVSGSFTVTDLLTVLADYGQTGSFGVSGSSTFQGDVNMDGNVNVNDLLTVLAGFNASGSNTITGSCEISGSNEPGSPPALIITGSTEITGSCIIDGPTTITDVLNVIGNYGQTGSLGVSGSTNLVGDLNCDGQVNVQDLLIATAGLQVTGSCTISEGPFTVDTFLTILASMSQTGSYDIQGDLNCDGVVSTADLLIALGGMQAGGDSEISGSLVISGSNSLTPTVEITGSLDCSGSVNVNGPFTVTDVLTVLADYGQTGSFSVSGSTWLDGDINLDGQVNVQDLLLVLSGLGNTSGSNVECSGSIDEVYDNDMYLYHSALSSAFPNDAMFNQLKVKSGSSYSQNFDPIVNYTGSGTIDFELPALSSIGLGVSYHILNRHNILHQQNVTMSISPASTDIPTKWNGWYY